MHVEVSFRNLRPREEVRRRVASLYGKLERFLDPASEGTVVITNEHGALITEVTVHVRGQVHTLREEDEDLRTSIDRAFHRVETALRRSKERRQDRRQRAAVSGDGFVVDDVDDDDELEELMQ